MVSQIMFVLLFGMIVSFTSVVTPQVVKPLYPISGTASSGSDDGSSPRITLQRPFVYFGRMYNQIYVNHNGHLTFDKPLRAHSPQRIPLYVPRDFIAPFWTDLDNRENGQIYYNQYTSGSILQQATKDINKYFPDIKFNANWVFVATWYEVAYYPNSGTRTTVQAVMISGGQHSFVLMNYGIIASTQWHVQAGFDTVNSTHYYSIPGSFTDSAAGSNSNFRLGSNVNVPGRWAFWTDHGSKGCTFNGVSLQLGDSFWGDSTCAYKCTCTSAGLQCHSQPCTFSQICQPDAFQFSCQTVKKGTCSISGDPHYYTFDDTVFHFQGTCTYVLSEPCGDYLPYYRVEGKNEHRGSTHVSWTRLVKVYVYNETIEIVKGRHGEAKVNGNFAATPISLSNGLVQVYESGFSVIVSTDFGLEVSYDTNHYVWISVPYTYCNATCGLCGNFNNDPSDDFRTRQGELVSSDVVFANSWQASGDDEPGCEPQCEGLDCAGCTEAQKALYSDNAHCGILQNTSGPFAACHEQLPPQAFVQSCVFDLCVGGGYQPILCQALSAYASQCQKKGVQLPSWRREGFCEIPCPANSHFESQGTGCPATCVNPNSTHNCPLPPQESCICNSGYILSGGVCVPHSECGCSFEGRYYRSGETVILDEDCGRRCSCSYGSMTCRSHGCGPFESCRVEEGERGCRPNNYGTCWIRGPGSYQTFDGLIYQYPGACRLTLAKVMGLFSHPHFVVTAEKVPKGQQGFARLIKFEAEGTHVSIEMESTSRVHVDGQRIRLPFSSASNRIQIYHSSVHSIILRTSFGVTVQTVWPHFVRVTAPVIYSGSLGGLCGNYNGHPHDDFRTPNGVLVNNSQDFGDSWRDGSLAAHCVENVNQNSTTNYNTSEYCGIIGSTHGPFAQCWAKVDPRQHVDACVEIMRTSRDPASKLCEVLRDYALMCQQLGVALGHWRDATGCEQNCPLNSHYEVCGTSCPSTCPSLSFPFACNTVCQEGCQCNGGFVLNGNQCAPPTHCGCYHKGRYWQGGEQFLDGEECQSLCTCDGTTGVVHCIPNSCGPQESCRVVEGELGCHPNPHGTCSASGDPHYLTFDGKAYDFQGTCRYILATLCNTTDGLHQFSVEAKNEPWRGLPVSVTAEVFVNVWGYQVHMSTERSGVVQVNGETRTLPIVLNGGQVSIYSSGPRVFVSADFGLSVTYDGYSTVFISVPANYRGQTCGLCGNFNGNPNDEFHTPSGTTVTTPDEFGKAWKVEGDYTCSDGCGSSCPQCTNDLPARAQCDVIQAADGPLGFCHEHVDPAPYFNDCVFDVCVSGNEGQDLLCRAIEAYISACQSANVQIYPWRQNTTCTLDCPANSHYELCGTDCGHTCAGSIDATCEQVCSEGCFCDKGFLRSGTRCVPVESCGCQDDGFYYDAGESFWTEGCSQRCECHAPNDLRCSAASCTATQKCTIQNGHLGCFDDMTTCTVWGDPHYITFDHKTYDFQGTCRYVLATLCDDTAGLHGFSVEAKNEPWEGLTVSVTAEVFVSVWGYQVHMSRGSHGVVQVNGETKNLPVLLNGTRISIYARGSHTYLSADFGLTVKYDGLYEVSISVPSTYRGQTCGLCGNFNGNPNDEFHTPSGATVTTPDEFGKAWKVEGDYTCSDGCGSSCPQCTNDRPARAQCEVIQAADGPFSVCHKHVDPAPYFKSCVFDVCVAGPDALCADIETYVSACQSANVQIGPWRQNTTCRLDCPANSHYELCGTDCGHTCASTNDATCEQGCSEGCFCDEGFLRSGTRCVPEGSCGCQYEGFYYNAGESFWTEGCSQRCECHAPNDLRCSAASCTSTQKCTIQNGQLGCYDAMSTCTVWGDLHYITFDHKTYDFQGTCRYVLATLCDDTAGLHGFSVEAKNEPWKGLTVSVTAEVFVNVWGYQVHMSRGSHGVVQVNGETKNLPVLLNGTRISIYARGSHTYLSADFGLTVKYDGLYEVSISVPSTYRGQTCGLCGNFNGNPNDEFHTPSGATVTTPDEFGKAWKVEGDYTCSDGCGSSCPQCTNDLPARAQCEVIQAADGPFSICHKHVDPAPYFKSCVFDVCVAGPDALCADIETYVSACQSANVQIGPWRQNTTCRLDCPANSHYELCGTDCGHTCASTNDATCEQGCSEGCFCDEGFLRSGTRCVPAESCGCQYDGFYYNAGESFWTEGCSQRCKCHAPNDLRCSAASCTATQKCTIQNGQLGCYDAMSTCTVWGDPHYITFDHKTYDFQGTCRYVLATLCDDTAGLHGFSVEAKNEPWKGLTVSVTAEVFVNVWGYQVHMSRGSHGVVQVNGETKNLPVLLNGTRISIYARGSHTYLSADFGLTVKYDGLYEVSISVPSTYRGQTCGLCGNFNGNPNDEFHTPSGATVTTPDEFGKAWKVEGDYTCSDGCGSSCPQCTNDLPARAQCEVIQAADGPFSICHKHVDPAPYFKSCVFDVCVAGPDALCADIETYVSACQSANVQIGPWRQNTTCRLDCPANSHYELCGTDCGHTCASTNDATCEQGCSEGCFCDEGFLRSGTRCVPAESCGCQYDGFYYNAGESFWTEGCSQRCKCHAPNDLRCSAASCTATQKCTIQNGQLGCYDAMSTCTVWGDPHYITFDGALAHFQGTCSYIITESVSHGTNETQFHVVATNNHRGNNRVSFVSAVDIYLTNHPQSVYIRIGPNKRVKINGIEVSLPITVGTFAQVERQGSYIIVNAIDLIVQFDGQSTLLVRMGQQRHNRVTGMCGNFNSDPADDKVLPNGTLAQNDNHFGDSWKSPTSQRGCGSTDEDSGDGLNDCPYMEEYSELCSVITNSSGPFSDCHLRSDPQPFFTSCVYDLCLYTPANGMLCSAVSAYERTCTVLGLNIPEWRPALLCAESDPCEQLDCTEYEWCGEQDGVYGCFCDEHHHRPNNGSYDSSITCVSSSGTISVSRCQLFEAGFHPSDLHLRDDSCKGAVQHGRLVFHFNNDDQLCGTVLRSNGTHFMYENTIQGDVDPHEGIISREKSIHLHFSCEYPLAQAVSMDVGINPLESIVNRRLPLGVGHYYLRMILYEDTGFRSPLTRNRNLEVEIDQKLYIEVQAEGVDEQQISTILDSCWATPFDDASYPVRWDLITAQCPNPADETVELIQNGVSTVARFSFRMFTFTNFSSIYLHCQVHLCLLRHNNCTAHCYPGYHTRVVRDVTHHDTAAISVGPLILRKTADEWMKPSSASGQLTSVMTLLISLLTAITLT